MCVVFVEGLCCVCVVFVSCVRSMSALYIQCWCHQCVTFASCSCNVLVMFVCCSCGACVMLVQCLRSVCHCLGEDLLLEVISHTSTSLTFHFLLDGLRLRTMSSTRYRKTEELIRETAQTPWVGQGHLVHPSDSLAAVHKASATPSLTEASMSCGCQAYCSLKAILRRINHISSDLRS